MPRYELVLQAAAAGHGVALGWAHLSDPLLAQGLLARIGSLAYRSGRRFRLLWPARHPLSPHAEIVRDAMLAPLA